MSWGGGAPKPARLRQGKWMDSLCLILTHSVFIPPLPAWIWLAGPYSHAAGLICRWQIGNHRENIHESKRHNENGRWRLLKVEKNVCFTRFFSSSIKKKRWCQWTLHNYFSLSVFFFYLWLVTRAPGDWSTPPGQPVSLGCPTREPGRMNGGRPTTPVLAVGSSGGTKTHCAGFTWRRRLGRDEVHYGCDWCWIGYLCITTYAESSLTFGPFFYGHSSAAE